MKTFFKQIYDYCNAFSIRIRNNHVDIYAASASFFIFISLIPFTLAVVSFIPITPISESDILNVVKMVAPSEFHALADSIVEELYGQHVSILSISAIIAIWAASRGLMSIRRGLDEIVGILEPPRYVIIRAKSVLYTVLMVILMVGLLLLGAFGRSVINVITRYQEYSMITIDPLFDYSYLFFLAGTFIFFIMLYSFLPHAKQKIKTQIPGAVVASAGWLLASKVFSFYASHSSILSMYGSLATIIILMFWVYIVMYLLFIGAQINYFIRDYIIKIKRDFLGVKTEKKGGEEIEGHDSEAKGSV
ncbi:MAG: YihY/virulence factor BrkB family protein, partial [Lachnospiraceae bacterium]|nr:YihY/virulence factor BrkB family protein [Lachnospiraceae bacterium]